MYVKLRDSMHEISESIRKYDTIISLFKLRSLRVIMKSEHHFIKNNLLAHLLISTDDRDRLINTRYNIVNNYLIYECQK